MKEVWKDIKGYEGLYQISNLGNVKSLDRKVNAKNNKKRLIKGTFLKLRFNNRNYNIVSLYKNNIQEVRFIHRLVAETFIPNPENKPEVNHIDGNKSNNRVDNLEWNTHSENIQHSWDNGLQYTTEKMRKAGYEMCKKMSIPIIQYTLNGEFVKEWNSAADVQRELNIYRSSISMCCKEKKKSSHGYMWRYKTEDYPLKINKYKKERRK